MRKAIRFKSGSAQLEFQCSNVQMRVALPDELQQFRPLKRGKLTQQWRVVDRDRQRPPTQLRRASLSSQIGPSHLLPCGLKLVFAANSRKTTKGNEFAEGDG